MLPPYIFPILILVIVLVLTFLMFMKSIKRGKKEKYSRMY